MSLANKHFIISILLILILLGLLSFTADINWKLLFSRRERWKSGKVQCHIINSLFLQKFSPSLVTQMVKNPPAIQDTQVWSLQSRCGEIEFGISGWRFPGERNGYPFQYSYLENSEEPHGLHRIANGWTWLRN